MPRSEEGCAGCAGDAWISFATAEEADRAVGERNRQHLGMHAPKALDPVAMALVLMESFLSAGNRYVELFKEAAS